jgi:heme oxygenase
VTAALDRLRTATQAEHRLLESELDLFRQPFGLTDYRELLSFFYSFHRPFENYLDAHPIDCAVADFYTVERRKAWRAHSDLLWLGVSPQILASLPLWPIPQLWVLQPAQVWGALYVFEGSALGAQVIAKHLKKSVPGLQGAGMQFFCGHGDRTPVLWRQFVGCFEELALSPAELEQAVVGACGVFASLRAWHGSPQRCAAPRAPR